MTYLAKDGQVSGPFDDNQITKMKESGDFYNYEWMWDGQAPDWSPVPRRMKGPPALPPEATKENKIPEVPGAKKEVTKTSTVSVVPAGTPAPSSPAASANRTKSVEIVTSNKVFPAVVFDNRQSVGGEVSQAHSRGGRFVSSPGASSHFPKGAQVSVDVLDEAQDKSAKVRATIATISRMENRWVFELEWTAMPLL